MVKINSLSSIGLSSLFMLISGSLFLSGCDAVTTPVENSEPVVEAYLVAGEPLPDIRLTRTAEITSGYSASALAIRDASVEVRLEGTDGTPDMVYSYIHSTDRPGIYEPETEALTEPGGTYHLTARIESTDEDITSSTVVPTMFEITDINYDSVVYQGDRDYEVSITTSSFPGRKAIYVQSIRALEPDTCELTPLYLQLTYEVYEGDEYDCTSFNPQELQDILLNSSPPLNEQNYETNPDGTIIIPLPWFAVAFYGEALVGTAAVDNSIYDFMRYQSVQTDGGSLSPGELPNVLDYINGGRGVFGAMAKVESVMTVTRSN